MTTSGGVKCWGRGNFGQLGNHSNTTKYHPVDVLNSNESSTLLSGIIQIAAGLNHTCALTTEGEVKCWGFNASGQLGDDGTGTKQRAVFVIDGENSSTPLSGIVQISAGDGHTCALTEGGGAKCWGKGAEGQLGNDDTTGVPYPVVVVASDGTSTPLSSIIQIGTGGDFTCALNSTSEVKCWGENDYGQLGNDKRVNMDHPVDVVASSGSPFSLSGIVQIYGGANHFCTLNIQGEIYCWGRGSSGRLGNNAADHHSAPVAVVSDTSGTPFHVGGVWHREYHCYDDDTCEIDPDSLIRPVLAARSGSSGIPPVEVLGLEEGESVTLHTDAKCAGDSFGTGTVATGETSVTITPTSYVPEKHNRIYAKVGEVCSLSGVDYTYTNGTERITGEGISTNATPTLTVALVASNDEISLHPDPDCAEDALASGTATTTTHDLTLPSLAPGSHTFYLKQNEICHPRGFDYRLASYIGEHPRVAAGGSHSCALTSSGGVVCWGKGGNGQLGNDGTSSTDAPVAVVSADGQSATLGGIVQVNAGLDHSCALTAAGGVKCWGEGSKGELGNNATTDTDAPVDVSGVGGSGTLGNIAQISVGRNHACALTSEGGVVCWGNNDNGRLGNDCHSSCTDEDAPVVVVASDGSSNPLTGIIKIITGGHHTCALTSTGQVKCWGWGARGQLGNSSTSDVDAPVSVVTSSTDTDPLSDIVQIDAGREHTCALTSQGTVKCWGGGSSGELGEKGTSNKDAPVDVQTSSTVSTPLNGITKIGAGVYFSCALTSTGGVKCWGNSGNGRLGDNCLSGTCNNATTPIDVLAASSTSTALSGIAQIGQMNNHICVVTSTGGVKCWGAGSAGRLGNDDSTDRDYPDSVVTADGKSTALNIGTDRSLYACTERGCGLVSE